MSTQSSTFSHKSFLLKIYVITILVIVLYLLMFPVLKPTLLKLSLLVVLGMALIIGYLMTRKSRSHTRSSHYYITCCYLVVLANVLISGGINAPGNIWFLVCPLVAFITLSTRVARFWLVVIVVTVVMLFVFDTRLAAPPLENPEVWKLVLYGLYFPMIYSIMRIFRREVSKKNVELNALNQRLQAETEALEKTQQEILSQTALIREAENKAQERSSKLGYYLDQLIEVKRMEEIHNGNLEYSLHAILQFLQGSLTLNNVMLWHLSGQGKSLALLKGIGEGGKIYTHAPQFPKKFIEAYEMLQTGAIINDCDNTIEAMQLKVLFENPSLNDSTIHCPYFMDGKFAGFISCRSVRKIWMPEDIIFVRAVSDTITLAFKSHHRILQQRILEEKQREITEVNSSLEQKVIERTKALNNRNKQLTDFAFTNAHHIRGPICRLQGLKILLAATDDHQEILKISDYMSTSIGELDQITRDTSEKLNALIEENE